MTAAPRMDWSEIVARSHLAVGGSQKEFAEKLGASRRTFTRWIASESTPSPRQQIEIVHMVHARDEALAKRITEIMGETLESLGVSPLAPSSSPQVDAIVSAAAEAIDVSPFDARLALVAALTRARQLGLGIDHVLAVLAPTKA